VRKAQQSPQQRCRRQYENVRHDRFRKVSVNQRQPRSSGRPEGQQERREPREGDHQASQCVQKRCTFDFHVFVPRRTKVVLARPCSYNKSTCAVRHTDARAALRTFFETREIKSSLFDRNSFRMGDVFALL
jgi:hypothetical protein